MLTQGWQSKAAARWEHDALPFAANISLSHGQIFLFATYLWCVFKPVHHCVSPLYVHFWEWVEGHLFLGSKNLSSILVVVNKPNNNYLLYFTNVSNLVSQLTEAGTGSCGSLGENFSKLRSEVKKDLTVVGTYLLEEDKILSIGHEGWQELAWNPGDVREQA